MRPVLRTSDFRRVEALPKRNLRDAIEASGSVERELKKSGSMSLRPIQSAALHEAAQSQGLLGCIGVGHGKTIISLLAASVIECERPLLLVPASLKQLTQNDRLPALKSHWKIHDNIRVESYNALSTDRELLNNYQPDLIISDECHKLAKVEAARTKRFLRYIDANDSVRFVGLSGTVSRKSIKDYWHLLLAALKDRAPIPLKWNEMNDWAMALDYGIRDHDRYAVGALKRFSTIPEQEIAEYTREDQLSVCRDAYRDRLTSTPGVVATSDEGVSCSLVIQRKTVDRYPANIDQALTSLRHLWLTPSGEEVTDALDFWRKAREISMGFYYEWKWEFGQADTEWLEARREWRSYVRRISSRHRKYDTELYVRTACEEGELISPEWSVWGAIKDRCKPETVSRWFSDEVLHDAIRNAKGKNAIIWYEHTTVGHRLATLSSWPLFDGYSAGLVEHVNKGRGPVIASIRAHGTGVNLQAYNDSIVLTPPSSGATWEQLLGRMHRQGQEADEVTYTVYQHTQEMIEALEKSIENASYIEKSMGQKQKLIYATFA